PRAEPPEGVPHALVERLQRRPPIAALRRLPAHEFVGRVIDRPEEPAPAIPLGPEARRVRAPELDGPVGRDAPGVGGIAMHMARPRRSEEPVDPHQPAARGPCRPAPPCCRSRTRTLRCPSPCNAPAPRIPR